jgi:uncharacterized protein with GYD domain
MATFLMFGKYSSEGLMGMSAERTGAVEELVNKLGGEIQALYGLLGENDLACLAEFPGTGQAMQASVAISKLTKIAITTSPAVPVEEFDKLMAEV